MNERLKILDEIDRIQQEHCKPCVFLDENGKALSNVNNGACHERKCPHITTLLGLGEQLSGITQSKRIERAARKRKKLSIRKEGDTLAKEPKWKLAGLTADLYQKLRSEGKTDRQIRDKFNIDNNELYKFKSAHDLVKKRTDGNNAPIQSFKAQQTPQEVAQVPTNKPIEQEVTESAKPDTTQTDAEKHIEELKAEIIKLEGKLATPAITHDDYGLLEQKLEANTVKLAEIVAQNKQLQSENEQLRVESVKGLSVNELLKEKIGLQLHNTKLKQELKELLADREVEKQHPPIQFETANPYIEMHDEQLIKNEQLTERVQELEDLVDQLMNNNGDLMQELQDVEELNYLNVLQFVKTYSQNKVNKRVIRNLERKGELA